jgi:hypothetical protein
MEWLNLPAISVGTPEVQAGYVRCATGQLLLHHRERRWAGCKFAGACFLGCLGMLAFNAFGLLTE